MGKCRASAYLRENAIRYQQDARTYLQYPPSLLEPIALARARLNGAATVSEQLEASLACGGHRRQLLATTLQPDDCDSRGGEREEAHGQHHRGDQQLDESEAGAAP